MCIPFRGHENTMRCHGWLAIYVQFVLDGKYTFPPQYITTYEFFVAAGTKPKLRFGYVTVVVVYPRQGASTPTSWQEPKAELTERTEGKSDPKEKDIPNRGIVGNKTTILFNRKSCYR